jgi:hypothetical protein
VVAAAQVLWDKHLLTYADTQEHLLTYADTQEHLLTYAGGGGAGAVG